MTPLPTTAPWAALVARYGPELAAFEVSARQAGQNGFDYWREWISGTGYLRRVFQSPAGFDAAGHGLGVQHLMAVFHQVRRVAGDLTSSRVADKRHHLRSET